MNPDNISISGEYVALFHIHDGVDIDKFWEWLSTNAPLQGVELRCRGSEPNMRIMLSERAKFIADIVNKTDESI